MASLESRIQRLEDIEEIKQLKAKYCRFCDQGYDLMALQAYSPKMVFGMGAARLVSLKGEMP